MKTKLITGLLATATVAACLMPVTVRATGTTTGGDTVSTTAEPTVPTQCIEYYPDTVGPSRAAHSSARPGILVDAPDCEDVEGVCVEFVFPDRGPSRSPHNFTIPTSEPVAPCVPAGPECDITVEVDPAGPARAAHQPNNVTRPQGTPYEVVQIPQACQDVLSAVAIPTTGSDSTNIIWLGTLLVGLGAVMLFTRRVATARSR